MRTQKEPVKGIAGDEMQSTYETTESLLLETSKLSCCKVMAYPQRNINPHGISREACESEAQNSHQKNAFGQEANSLAPEKSSASVPRSYSYRSQSRIDCRSDLLLYSDMPAV